MAGFELVLAISDRDPKRACDLVEALRELRAAGMIIAPCGDSLPRAIAVLRQMPLRAACARNRSFDVPTMTLLDRLGAALAISRPVQLGHRRMAFLGGSGGIGTPPVPPAVVTAHSEPTQVAVWAVHQAGLRVPEQLSIVGFGDLDRFRCGEPGVTVIDWRTDRLAQAAALHLFEQGRQGGDFRPPVPFTAARDLQPIVWAGHVAATSGRSSLS